MALPAIAQAQVAEFVSASSINGVTSVQTLANGTASMTMANGSVISIPAGQFSVLAGGQVMVAPQIAQLAAQAMAAGAAGGIGLGAAVAGAGVAGAVAVGAGGGGGDGPSPLLFLSSQSAAIPPTVVNNATVSEVNGIGSNAIPTELPEGTTQLRITFDDGSEEPRTETVTVDEKGIWVLPLEAEQGPTDLPQGLASLTLVALDDDGEELGTATTQILVDTIPPTVAVIDIASSGDNNLVVNIAERAEPVTISGVSDAEDGQIVTITLNDVEYTGELRGGEWSIEIPPADLANLPDTEVDYLISPVVSDAAGNETTRDAAILATDFVPPVISINPVSLDDVVGLTDLQGDLTITGTTNADPGQQVTVLFNGIEYQGEVAFQAVRALDMATMTNGDGPMRDPAPLEFRWSVTIPQGDLLALQDQIGDEDPGQVQIIASVFDSAGNPSEPAGRTIEVDFRGPSLTIDPITGDNIINFNEDGLTTTISGTTNNVEQGQAVSVTVNGTLLEPAIVQLDGSWQTTLGPMGVTSIIDGGSVDVVANVSNAEAIAAPTVTVQLARDVTAPTIDIDAHAISVGAVMNIAESADDLTLGGATTAEDGQQVTVTIAGTEFTTQAEGGAWTLTIPNADLPDIADGDTVEITADVEDVAGNSAQQATASFDADLSAPTITIDGQVADDGTLNIAEQAAGFTINGTATGVEDGQTVTIMIGDSEFTTTVGRDAWSLDLTSEDLAEISDGDTLAVTANVSDLAGNPAAQASASLTADLSAPTVTITEPVSEDGFLNIAEQASSITIRGTAVGVEDGLSVVVDIDDIQYTAAVTDEAWALVLTSDDLEGFSAADGQTITIAADVGDAAGNPALQARASLDIDLTAPTISFVDDVPAEYVLTLAELAADPDSGTEVTTDAPQGTPVTLTFADANDVIFSVRDRVSDGGTFAIDFLDADLLAALSDQTAYTVTVEIGDDAGNTASDSFSLTTDFKPSLTLNEVGVDGAIDLDGAALTAVTGTALGADGRTVTVTFVNIDTQAVIGTTTGDVTNGAWSAPVNAALLEQISAGQVYTVNADVSNADGRAADTVSQSVSGYLPSEFGYFLVFDSSQFVTILSLTGEDYNSNDGFRTEISFDPLENPYVPNSVVPNSGLTIFLPNEAGAGDGTLLVGGGTLTTPLQPLSPLFLFDLDSDGQNPITVRFDHEVKDITSGSAELIIGTMGDDVLLGDNIDSFIRGRGGDDVINVGASGANVVVFETTPLANGVDTVAGFTIGLGDAVDDTMFFQGQIDLRGDGTIVEALAGGTIGANTGFVIFTTAQAIPSVSDALNAVSGFGPDEQFYLMVGDGTNAQLALVTTDANSSPTAEVMADFQGIGGLDQLAPSQIILSDPTGQAVLT
ncbi:Ig-like domain-containing protein [Roseovarius sp.]